MTAPDGETVRIALPPAPRLTLLERLRWQLHCWHIGARNLLFWLKGGRW